MLSNHQCWGDLKSQYYCSKTVVYVLLGYLQTLSWVDMLRTVMNLITRNISLSQLLVSVCDGELGDGRQEVLMNATDGELKWTTANNS